MAVNPDFKARHYSTSNISETIQERHMVTIHTTNRK